MTRKADLIPGAAAGWWSPRLGLPRPPGFLRPLGRRIRRGSVHFRPGGLPATMDSVRLFYV